MKINHVFGIKKIAFLVTLFLISITCWGQASTTSFFKIQASKTTFLNIEPILFETSGIFPLSNTTSVYGLSVSGHVVLKDETNSMVRITAECSDGIEYLVYETHPLLTDTQEFDIQDMAFETAILQAENLTRLKITLLNASFILQDVKYASSATESALHTRKNLQKEQENAVIERLNENLERKGMLWRAGNTSISELSYEQKKAMFGDSVPYLGGFEYYIGGIFVMPGYDLQSANKANSTSNDTYVKAWDWRNRHGKNWMTSIKKQGACNSCAIFALLGTIEAYANLYYNRKIDLDLSEQELLCATAVPICDIGATFEYVFYNLLIKNGGVMEESCFPYVGKKSPCNQCDNPTENLNVDSVNIFHTIDQTEIKRMLFKAPIAISSEKAWHGMVLTGYKRLEAGDKVSYPKKWPDTVWEIECLNSDSPLIGSTAWLVKNSWGDWGDNGYCLMVEDICNVNKDKVEIIGRIHSLQYTDKDIVVEDADGDGYYFWGIGERPQNLPAWIPEQADGDDSDPTKGPLDTFGNLRTLSSTNSPYEIHITNATTWSSFEYCLPNVYVESNATLTITGNICLNRNSRIFVKPGGKLTIDGGTVEQADVAVSQGGICILKNNGVLKLGEGDSFKPESGSALRIENGFIRKQ